MYKCHMHNILGGVQLSTCQYTYVVMANFEKLLTIELICIHIHTTEQGKPKCPERCHNWNIFNHILGIDNLKQETHHNWNTWNIPRQSPNTPISRST